MLLPEILSFYCEGVGRGLHANNWQYFTLKYCENAIKVREFGSESEIRTGVHQGRTQTPCRCSQSARRGGFVCGSVSLFPSSIQNGMKGMNFIAPSTCSNFSYTSAMRDNRIVVDRRFPRLIRFDTNCLLACMVEDSFKYCNTRNKIKQVVMYTAPDLHTHCTYVLWDINHLFQRKFWWPQTPGLLHIFRIYQSFIYSPTDAPVSCLKKTILKFTLNSCLNVNFDIVF